MDKSTGRSVSISFLVVSENVQTWVHGRATDSISPLLWLRLPYVSSYDAAALPVTRRRARGQPWRRRGVLGVSHTEAGEDPVDGHVHTATTAPWSRSAAVVRVLMPLSNARPDRLHTPSL